MKTYTHCERCGKRKKPPARPQKGVSQALYEADPYCSRDCAVKAQRKGTQ